MKSEKQQQPRTKCCNTCPFLIENYGRPNPEFANMDQSEVKEWFSQKNISSIAEGLRDGGILVCHSSDKNGQRYGSVNAKETKVCIGAVISIFQEIDAYSKEIKKDGNPEKAHTRYKEGREHAMTLRGIQEWIWRFTLGRVGLFDKTPIPLESEEERPVFNVNSNLQSQI